MNKDLYLYGLRLLGRKPYTSHELAEKLRKKFPQDLEDVHNVITALEEERFLNDRVCMETYVAYAFHYRLWSLRKVREKMLKRGIDATMLQQYLGETEHYDERNVLERLYAKKFLTPPSKEDKLKFIRSLEQKGFFLGNIIAIVGLQ